MAVTQDAQEFMRVLQDTLRMLTTRDKRVLFALDQVQRALRRPASAARVARCAFGDGDRRADVGTRNTLRRLERKRLVRSVWFVDEWELTPFGALVTEAVRQDI